MGIRELNVTVIYRKRLKPNELDSRLRGNDESIRTETCTTSFPRTYIPSFPRKWESRTKNLKKPFYPISFRTDRSGFPPARE
ncbi:pilus assembly protein PilS [Neisseria meningitidis]|nr:pilus assembly protein PilS [Neisseria meningitidis]